VVRVRLVPGTGKFDLDGRSLEAYFPNKVHQQLIKAPLVIVDRRRASTSSPTCTVAARPVRPARCDWRSRGHCSCPARGRPALKKAGFLTRDPRATGARSTAEEGP